MYPNMSNGTLAANTVLGYIFFIPLIITPILSIGFYIKNSVALSNPESGFSKKFGTMFGEFKNNKGPVSTMFYGWFFVRRALYSANIIFLRDFILGQFVVNVLHTILSLVFLSSYAPFTSRMSNFAAIFEEVGVSAVFSLCTAFEFQPDENASDIIMWTCIGVVMTMILVSLADIVVA